MNTRHSIKTFSNPQIIDLQPIDLNPFMSKCTIKVMYLGENDNGTSFDESTARNMARTLRGCPIVGYFKDNKEDFTDHGERIILESHEITRECMTKPYGFVSPDSLVWFQDYEDIDRNTNEKVIRTYLCVEGYLWTGQFEEVSNVIENKNPQSMELDDDTMTGFWSESNNSDYEIFIVNDAIFTKLCILGENVEPCFEGSQFLPATFSNKTEETNFVAQLIHMAQELNEYLSTTKKGEVYQMGENERQDVVDTQQTVDNIEQSEYKCGGNDEDKTKHSATDEAAPAKDFAEDASTDDKDDKDESKDDKTEDSKDKDKDDSKDDKTEEPKDESKDDSKDDKKDESKDDKKDTANNDKKKPETKNSAPDKTYSLLIEQIEQLKAENKALRQFKHQVESEKKDELINSFYMLSDEEKKDVIDNKDKYSLDDIESKLSVLYVKTKVDLTASKTEEQLDDFPPMTYNLNSQRSEELPNWLKAVENTVKNK